MPCWKVIPHYGTVSNNGSDEEKLFGRRGDAESGPLACLRLKLNHRVAFKRVCWVIKVDKTLLLSPSDNGCMVVRHLLDNSEVKDHDWDLASSCFADNKTKITNVFSDFCRLFLFVSFLHPTFRL